MATITDYYNVYYKDHCIAAYYIYGSGETCYSTSNYALSALRRRTSPRHSNSKRNEKVPSSSWRRS